MVGNVEGDKPESVEDEPKNNMCVLGPAEKKGEVGDVEDWFPAPLVHQLPKCEGVDNGAHVRGRDHPWTADFLEEKPNEDIYKM